MADQNLDSDTATNAGGDNAATQGAKTADAPVYTKAQLTEKIAREVARVAQERDAQAAKLAEYEAERAKAEEAKLSATQRAELERKRAEEKTAAEIATLKSAAAAERTKRHEVLRQGRAASLAAQLAAQVWTPDLMPHVESAIAQRLVVVDDGKGGESVMLRMGAEGDNEPLETGFAKLREEPQFKGFIRINGGSGAQHGAAGAKGSDRWTSLSPTDRIKAGLSK